MPQIKPKLTEKPFTDRMFSHLSMKLWRQAQQLVLRNRCVIAYSDSTIILALARGDSGQIHKIAFEFLMDGPVCNFSCGCDCRHFQRTYSCSHIGAAVLMTDALGISRQLPLIDNTYISDLSPPVIDDLFQEQGVRSEEFAKLLLAGNPVGQVQVVPTWKQKLTSLKKSIERTASSEPQRYRPKSSSKSRRYFFGVDLVQSKRLKKLVMLLFFQEQLKSGNWGTLREVRTTRKELLETCRSSDRELMEMVFGAEVAGPYGYQLYERIESFVLTDFLSNALVPKLCAGQQLFAIPKRDTNADVVQPLKWDGGRPWCFDLSWNKDVKADEWKVAGQITRQLPDGSDGPVETCPLKDIKLVLPAGLCLQGETFARMQPLTPEQIQMLEYLQKEGGFAVPQKEIDPFVAALSNLSHKVPLALPAEIHWETLSPEGLPRIEIQPAPKYANFKGEMLVATVSFDYAGQRVAFRETSSAITDADNRRMINRDRDREEQRMQELLVQGFLSANHMLAEDFDLQIPAKKLPTAVLNLASQGWHIEAEGAVMRRPGKINISICSGVDWFDLTAECDFDGVKASLPALLAAMERGQKFVELGDGSKGMLPEEWLAKYAPLAEMGETKGDSLRFLPTQAIILDALLAAQPDATHDKKFAEVRDRLKNFGGVKALHEPESFQGSLREYQRDGLGWLHFLEEFGFGGCLADDMGLGKTVQVLAMLERRRTALTEKAATNGKANGKAANGSKKKADAIAGPLRTLVVAPKSLIFNWLDEAKRFAPQLKTFDYTGIARKDSPEAMAAADLIVTTYGTLRQDILTLREMDFHQVILDEAQAIKNPASQSAKACRLVQARHRLAMTGTPVENRLGDLWSIFEFLNPGMLGRSSNIRLFSGRTLPDKESLELLSRALRPFLLRRTKEQVLKELPAKTEQTLFCEMDGPQRKLYNELRDHYRALLTQKIKDTGLARSKIQVLEALLRLRQAACHPGLLDKKKADLPSAKFDALLAQLEEVVAEKHKVLVFSQFTSLLALVKKELDKANITYEYLDGKTSNRKEKVDRFQNDPECPVFLISLKAGGHGLNLTAADYVYILDPWWNPAVEAQAVDRAHRLGQDKPVFVYRLIATGTVEEKILELQGQKRDLADAIISADESLLRNLSADDLQLLLS